MVCIKSDCFFFFSCYFYREWLTKLIGKINLLTYSKIFGTWKLCDFQGVSLKEIQAWLGHSTIGTTANIYTHLDENNKLSSANAILSILPEK